MERQDGSELASVSGLASDTAECLDNAECLDTAECSDSKSGTDKKNSDEMAICRMKNSLSSNESPKPSCQSLNPKMLKLKKQAMAVQKKQQLLKQKKDIQKVTCRPKVKCSDAKIERNRAFKKLEEVKAQLRHDIRDLVEPDSPVLVNLLKDERKKLQTIDDIKGEKAYVNFDKYRFVTSDTDDEEMVYVEIEQKLKLDCETILSTGVFRGNQPTLIPEPKTVPKKKS